MRKNLRLVFCISFIGAAVATFSIRSYAAYYRVSGVACRQYGTPVYAYDCAAPDTDSFVPTAMQVYVQNNSSSSNLFHAWACVQYYNVPGYACDNWVGINCAANSICSMSPSTNFFSIYSPQFKYVSVSENNFTGWGLNGITFSR